MAHLSKIFTKVPVDLPNKSGFDMSHENLFTAKCGTLTPCLVEELLPNDEISLGEMCQVQLPPMATDFYGRIDACIEAFFVPYRILWGGWQDFITNPTTSPYAPNTNPPKKLPSFSVNSSLFDKYLGRGSLADFLGYKGYPTDGVSTALSIPNALPFLAYHKIFEDWYMNTEIQKTPFLKGGVSILSRLPWLRDTFNIPVEVSSNNSFNDGLKLTDLRQRLWAKDYFTTANLYPQAGGASELSFDVADSRGSFTIASLRAANVLQRWLERNNIAGYRYADQIKAQFGCLPSDAVLDRSIFLGRTVHSVYTKSVYNTAGSPSATSPAESSSGNPFGGSAAKFGTSQAVGEGSLIQKFRATEHGFIMCIFSLVPHAYYSSGTRRYLSRSKVGDFAFPLLQGIGEQSIGASELCTQVDLTLGKSPFGYTDQYAEYKYHDDEVHGLLVDGQSLESFALQRSFTSAPTLGSSFLEIPINFLDQVTAVQSAVSDFGCWVDMYLSMKKVSTLSAYQIPTLGDIKNTHREYIDKGGRRL